MLGEALTSVAVTERGLCGDRVSAVLDDTGTVGSTNTPASGARCSAAAAG
ncbi:hypothetical protein [Streptomyces sp. NPDC002788]